MITITDTIISQYYATPRIQGLVEWFNAVIDPRFLLDDFYTKIWNLDTAEDYGLDIWGRILGVSRYGTPASSYTLDNTTYRKLLKVKALTNISDCSIPTINSALQQILAVLGYTSGQRAYVINVGTMKMFYIFEFVLTSTDLAILASSGVLLCPAGVQTYILQIDPLNTFGFSDSGFQPFNQGTFSPGAYLVS